MDPILNPTIYVCNFEWREPVTTLTDLLVSMVAFYGFVKYWHHQGNKNKSFLYFKYYLLCFTVGMASAALLGHGLQAYVGPEYKRIGWICSAIGLFLFGLGSIKEIEYSISKTVKQIILFLFIIQFMLFVLLMVNPNTSNFVTAQLSSTISLIGFILPIHLYNFIKNKNQASFIVIAAISYSVLPAFVYNYQLSFNNWFNYHDISHVLMAIFMLFMIKGTFKLSTQKKS
jgi:hypothetical protein